MAIYRVSDRETIASVSSSVGITSSLLSPDPGEIVYALIQAISDPIRMTIDGTTPTSSKGIKLLENSTVEIWGTEALSDFRCIDDGGTATVEVILYGTGL